MSYQPATEVGGDFFQIFPASNDSLLVIVGDVSGKGMRAALVVSVIVGALQNRRSDSPAALLGELNAVLLTRSEGGFTTCSCALFTPDGSLTIANAEHLAPYRNGEEVAVPPGLPLGIAADSEWEETRIILKPGDRLLWVSDGVVEDGTARAICSGSSARRSSLVSPLLRSPERRSSSGRKTTLRWSRSHESRRLFMSHRLTRIDRA